MCSKYVSTLDLEMNLDVNTEESCSRALQTIIQVLLFQRSQIPFCYEVFKTIVNKLKTEMAAVDSSKWGHYQLAKQRETAINTLGDIQTLFKEVTEIVRRSEKDVQAMVLFGSTLYTAKEAFIINIPAVDRRHYPQHHRQGLEAALKHLTRQIILSEELRPSGRFIGPTNIFTVLGMAPVSDTKPPSRNVEYRLLDGYQLPTSCLKYVINVSIRGAPEEQLGCCRQMDVFSDSLQLLKIEDSEVVSSENQKKARKSTETETVWYQLGKGLKGYNDILIKGKSIWNEGL